MKKLFMVVCIALILVYCIIIGQMVSKAFAQEMPEVNLPEIFSRIENVDTGGYYSLIDQKFNFSATIKLVTFKDFYLSAGYAGRAKNTADKLIATLSFSALKLKDYVNIPVLDLVVVDPYITAGYGRIDLSDLAGGEFDYGVGANLIKWSW